MSEMLGNRYLLELRFEEAIPHFESRLRKEPCDRKTAQKLALCHALAGHKDAAAKWFRLSLEAGAEEHKPESLLWQEVAQSIRARRDALGSENSAIALALAQLFRSPGTAVDTVEHVMEETPTPPGSGTFFSPSEIEWRTEMRRTIERTLCGWLLAGAVGWLALGLVACSDDDDNHPLTPEERAASTVTPTKPASWPRQPQTTRPRTKTRAKGEEARYLRWRYGRRS
ncbi:MAG: tetratricopeptide repeat protein [Candidatus Eisenbacteria bacterium]